jgi:glycosyltransferase involved in cell wall biosynthesis
MRILFLSCWFPYPPTNGSKLRILNLLRELTQRHEVTLLSFADQPDVDPAAPALAMCRAVEVVPAQPLQPHTWAARIGYLRAAPRSIAATYSEEMAQRIDVRLTAEPIDLVIASQWSAAGYVHCCAGVPALFEEVELGSVYRQLAPAPSMLQRARYSLTWLKHRRYLARLLRQFRACTVVSEHERHLLATSVPQHPPITVIPNSVSLVDYEDVRETPHPNRLIFAGSFRYAANHDAMCWFVREVLPLIRARAPEVHLTITGDAAQRRLPPAPNVVQTGHLDDVRPLIAASSVSLAPLRMGGGTRLKILEAMALGTPVVATPKGAEGLDVADGEHLLIADGPRAFAAQVVRLLSDDRLRDRLRRNARRLVAERYEARVVGPQFERLVVQVAGAAVRES